jgi:hypothetical protein
VDEMEQAYHFGNAASMRNSAMISAKTRCMSARFRSGRIPVFAQAFVVSNHHQHLT